MSRSNPEQMTLKINEIFRNKTIPFSFIINAEALTAEISEVRYWEFAGYKRDFILSQFSTREYLDAMITYVNDAISLLKMNPVDKLVFPAQLSGKSLFGQVLGLFSVCTQFAFKSVSNTQLADANKACEALLPTIKELKALGCKEATLFLDDYYNGFARLLAFPNTRDDIQRFLRYKKLNYSPQSFIDHIEAQQKLCTTPAVFIPDLIKALKKRKAELALGIFGKGSKAVQFPITQATNLMTEPTKKSSGPQFRAGVRLG